MKVEQITKNHWGLHSTLCFAGHLLWMDASVAWSLPKRVDRVTRPRRKYFVLLEKPKTQGARGPACEDTVSFSVD